jgi:hypothetical protein
MAFNANTYRMNQARREAWARLAEARDIKARTAAGTAYAWEADRIASRVKLARIAMHLHLSYCRVAGLNAAAKRIRNGNV